MKNVFYFIKKALFICETFKFLYFCPPLFLLVGHCFRGWNTPSIWSICSKTASTFLTEYRSSSSELDFLNSLECSFLLFCSDRDVWYASQCSVGLLLLFPGSISVSLLLTAGAPSTIFDVASDLHRLQNLSIYLLMKFQEIFPHCFLLRVFHPTEVISRQCKIDLMTSLHQMLLHSNLAD